MCMFQPSLETQAGVAGTNDVSSNGVSGNEGAPIVGALLGSRSADSEGSRTSRTGTSHPPSDVSGRVVVSPPSGSR